MALGRPSLILARWGHWLVAPLVVLGVAGPCEVEAHTQWADGTPVPEWVRNACCEPGDIHHLRPFEVHPRTDGFAIDGLQAIVPFAKVLPSMDGDAWVFFRNFDDGTQYVFCLFVPPLAGS